DPGVHRKERKRCIKTSIEDPYRPTLSQYYYDVAGGLRAKAEQVPNKSAALLFQSASRRSPAELRGEAWAHTRGARILFAMVVRPGFTRQRDHSRHRWPGRAAHGRTTFLRPAKEGAKRRAIASFFFGWCPTEVFRDWRSQRSDHPHPRYGRPLDC